MVRQHPVLIRQQPLHTGPGSFNMYGYRWPTQPSSGGSARIPYPYSKWKDEMVMGFCTGCA